MSAVSGGERFTAFPISLPTQGNCAMYSLGRLEGRLVLLRRLIARSIRSLRTTSKCPRAAQAKHSYKSWVGRNSLPSDCTAPLGRPI